jgi:hypothetical protein
MLYRNHLKNWIYGKEALRNFRLERETIVREQGSSEGGNFEVKPTHPETDSSSGFGIYGFLLFLLLATAACSGLETSERDKVREQNAKGEYIYRQHNDHHYPIIPATPQTRDPYPWEDTSS